MNFFLQCLVSGVAIGSIYIMLALGYTIIFSTMKMSHFAQGDFFMIGAFLGYTFFMALNLPLVVAVIMAVIGTVAVLLIVERLAYRKLYHGDGIYLILSTIGVGIFLRNLAQIVWSAETLPFDSVFKQSTFNFGGVVVNSQYVAIIAVCLILMVLLYLFMMKTKTGVAMQAVSMNRTAAALAGINIPKIIQVSYVIAAGLAAVAGFLLAPIYRVYATMGVTVGTKALTAAILGGFGDVRGAMVGGLLLGIIETLGSAYISSGYRDAFSFLVLIIVLMIRPQGLFGKARITKV